MPASHFQDVTNTLKAHDPLLEALLDSKMELIIPPKWLFSNHQNILGPPGTCLHWLPPQCAYNTLRSASGSHLHCVRAQQTFPASQLGSAAWGKLLEREEGKRRGRRENSIKNKTKRNIELKRKGIDLEVTQRLWKTENKKNAELQWTRQQHLNQVGPDLVDFKELAFN